MPPERSIKRTVQDSAVDLSKMKTAQNRLQVLNEERGGDDETKEILQIISQQVQKLENILKGANKSRITFSALTVDHLEKAGVTGKYLYFDLAKVSQLRKELPASAVAEVQDLYTRIVKIYSRVSMDYEPGPRMIIDAVLLAVAEVLSTENRDVVIPFKHRRVGPRVAVSGVTMNSSVLGANAIHLL